MNFQDFSKEKFSEILDIFLSEILRNPSDKFFRFFKIKISRIIQTIPAGLSEKINLDIPNFSSFSIGHSEEIKQDIPKFSGLHNQNFQGKTHQHTKQEKITNKNQKMIQKNSFH